jgi:hypothetical protein
MPLSELSPFPAARPKGNGHAKGDTRSRFNPVRFKDIALTCDPPYLVKGLLPREGLIVVWGPPKCGKSFWVFDLALHVALGWEYRGRRVQVGTVCYVACEGEGGLGARSEAFRQRKLEEGADPSFFLLEAIDTLVTLMRRHDEAPAVAERAAEALLDRGWGGRM